MVERKDNTLQKKLGFDDKDLTTPMHDEMMVWLDKNSKTILNKMVEERDLKQECIDEIEIPNWNLYSDAKTEEEIEVAKKQLYDQVKLMNFSNIPKMVIYSSSWEYPVHTFNGFIVGFVDLNIIYTFPDISTSVSTSPPYKYSIDIKTKSDCFYFEVKTKIPSLGELIRQINTYRSFISHGTFLVVSPDDRFKEILKSQGIGFVKYPEMEVTLP